MGVLSAFVALLRIRLPGTLARASPYRTENLPIVSILYGGKRTQGPECIFVRAPSLRRIQQGILAGRVIYIHEDVFHSIYHAGFH